MDKYFSIQGSPGLIPRFIVAAHRNLTEKKAPWRSGGVFQYSGSCVLIEGDVEKKVIDIAVTDDGANRRAALHVMLNYFDQVHRLNPEAMPEAFVPMPDNPEIEESYTHLLSLEKDEGADYRHRPTGSKHSYRVGNLLDGVGRDRGSERLGATGMNIKGGSGNINVTVVNGRVDGTNHKIGQHTSHAKQNPVPTEAPGAPNWPRIAIGSGVAAVVLVVIIALLPPEWQLSIGGLAALFAGVTAFVFFRNPAWFYKRMIGVAMAAGLFWSAFGAYLEIKLGQTAVVTWKSQVDPVIYVFVIVVIVACAWADVSSQEQHQAKSRVRVKRPG